MGGAHSDLLFRPGSSPVHWLASEVKVAAAVGFVAAVAVTPQRSVWAFGLHAVVVATVVAVTRLPLRFVLTRLLAVVPFITFALLVPFVAGGEELDVAGIGLSVDGLWSAFAIVARAGLGATISIALAGTTRQFDLLKGLRRLRAPALLVAIAAFMLRYLDLLVGELARMRTAMACRGYAPRWLWQSRPLAAAAGALFVRSYERGERIGSAMLSRGFTGTMPDLDRRRATGRDWLVGATLPAVGLTVAITARVLAP